MPASDLTKYRTYVKRNLNRITEILAHMSMGDFSRRIDLDRLRVDEFYDVLAGLELTMDDLAQARLDLDRQNSFNKLRAEIWEAAIAGFLSEDELIQRLLDIVGSRLSVRRASYFAIGSREGEAVVVRQWRAEGIPPSLGLSVPHEVYRHFLPMDYAFIEPEALRDLPDQTQGQIEKLFRKYDIRTFLAVRYGSRDTPHGFFTFSSKEARHWNDLEVNILLEVVRILTVRVAQVEAENRLREVNSRLEEKVRERTAQLALTNQELQRDIEERKRTEEALAAEKERLGVTLRSIGDGVIATDTEGSIALTNFVAEELTGWKQEECIGRPIDEVFRIVTERTGRRSRNPVERVMERKAQRSVEGRNVLIGREGDRRVIVHNASGIFDRKRRVVGIVLVFRDITQQVEMENELLQARKLESVGVLAGGIAHDFNNVLTGIITSLFMAKMSLRDNPEAHQLLTDAEKAAFRASRLTKQLLTFSKGGAPVKEATSIREVVSDAVGFCLSGSNVDYRLDLPGDLPAVEVDRGQIDQVINNLVINADQAMPAGGLVQVRAHQVAVCAGDKIPVKEGHYVRLEVEDRGSGIPPEHRQRVFDPYFTTKQTGSGLGLTTAYSIVKKHDGYLTFVSRPGKGTTFQLYLPVSDALREKDTEPADEPACTGGRVLLMDDDDTVRMVARKLLVGKGFDVEAVADPADAVRKYREAIATEHPFDAAVLDLTIPGGKGGKETAAELLKLDPDAKLVVASGYSSDQILANYRDYGFSGMIAKPFEVSQLVRTLSRVIRGRD